MIYSILLTLLKCVGVLGFQNRCVRCTSVLSPPMHTKTVHLSYPTKTQCVGGWDFSVCPFLYLPRTFFGVFCFSELYVCAIALKVVFQRDLRVALRLSFLRIYAKLVLINVTHYSIGYKKCQPINFSGLRLSNVTYFTRVTKKHQC